MINRQKRNPFKNPVITILSLGLSLTVKGDILLNHFIAMLFGAAKWYWLVWKREKLVQRRPMDGDTRKLNWNKVSHAPSVNISNYFTNPIYFGQHFFIPILIDISHLHETTGLLTDFFFKFLCPYVAYQGIVKTLSDQDRPFCLPDWGLCVISGTLRT